VRSGVDRGPVRSGAVNSHTRRRVGLQAVDVVAVYRRSPPVSLPKKLIQERSRRNGNEYILYKIAAAASHTTGFQSVHLPAKLPHRTGHASFLT